MRGRAGRQRKEDNKTKNERERNHAAQREAQRSWLNGSLSACTVPPAITLQRRSFVRGEANEKSLLTTLRSNMCRCLKPDKLAIMHSRAVLVRVQLMHILYCTVMLPANLIISSESERVVEFVKNVEFS
jgi:hypothetical protein